MNNTLEQVQDNIQTLVDVISVKGLHNLAEGNVELVKADLLFATALAAAQGIFKGAVELDGPDVDSVRVAVRMAAHRRDLGERIVDVAKGVDKEGLTVEILERWNAASHNPERLVQCMLNGIADNLSDPDADLHGLIRNHIQKVAELIEAGELTEDR